MNYGAGAGLPIFRSPAQLKILGHLLINAGRSYTIPQLVDVTGVSQPTAWREVDRLRRAGILTSVRMGRTEVVRADETSRFFPELQSLALKLIGPAVLLRERIADVAGVEGAWIFGSWAARYLGEPGPPPADIDVVVVGDVEPDVIDDTVEPLQQVFGMPVNPLVVSRAEWASADSGFLRQLKTQPLVPVLDGPS
ncbi:MAG: winged helix-turn-helix domain-containing protein [Actinomycetota bacterium]|nr:winged helix-turn-helix domain-containing protein [Actinomycetota bacterium]